MQIRYFKCKDAIIFANENKITLKFVYFMHFTCPCTPHLNINGVELLIHAK
jgi:hypothetical protein